MPLMHSDTPPPRTGLRRLPAAVEIDVLVQPRASRSRLAGWHDGRLKVSLTAPPVDGEANEALLAFLSKLLSVPRREVRLLRGETSRRKTVQLPPLPSTAFALLSPSEAA
jgi:uncharacterized protein (TIGR00251 family)